EVQLPLSRPQNAMLQAAMEADGDASLLQPVDDRQESSPRPHHSSQVMPSAAHARGHLRPGPRVKGGRGHNEGEGGSGLGIYTRLKNTHWKNMDDELRYKEQILQRTIERCKDMEKKVAVRVTLAAVVSVQLLCNMG
ncbi:hypothetical protein CYMTET_33321, partial [Cymbomonas tetramitiformis]